MRAATVTARAMAEHWTARAHRFDGAASHLRHADAWRKVLAAAFGETPRDLVDLGAGTGAVSLVAAELGHRVVAVDGSSGMLAFARTAARERGLAIRFVEATMDDASLADASADIVTMRNVLWTLENPDGAIALARRILRPGGRLVIADGMWRQPDAPATGRDDFGTPLPFHDGLTEADGRALLERGGFESLRAWHHLFDAHPYDVPPYDVPGGIPFFVLSGGKPA